MADVVNTGTQIMSRTTFDVNDSEEIYVNDEATIFCKLKIEMDRGTTDDQSNIQGLQFEYKKS